MTESLDERNCNLLVGVRRSVRYHDHRHRLYEIWNTVTVAVATVGASASFLAKATPEWVSVAVSALVAVVGANDLSVGTARRADQHGSLARQFIILEREFAHGRSLDNDERERLRIERRNRLL